MDHREALPFTSAVIDRQNVPAQAAQHIRNCQFCRERLRDYEEMGIELRLLAAAENAESVERSWSPPPRTLLSAWAQSWKGRVLVPKPALAFGVAVIVALSVGLGYLQAQGRQRVFHFEISSPQAEGIVHWGANLGIGDKTIYRAASPNGEAWARFQVLGVRNGVLYLAVQARRFDSHTPDAEARRSLENVPAREYEYVSGETLKIPVKDWGTLSLKGELLDRGGKFRWENHSIVPWPNQMVLKAPVLLKDKELVFQDAAYGGSAAGPNPMISFYAPGEGRFIFKLKPFKGAVPGLADFSQVHFNLGGEQYLLSCATPITGGTQPRRIWVYLDRSYRPPKRPW